MKWAFKSAAEIKNLSDKQTEEIHCPQACFSRNVKRSSSGRIKMIYVRNTDLYKERKNIGKRIKKVKYFIFFLLIELIGNCLKH